MNRFGGRKFILALTSVIGVLVVSLLALALKQSDVASSGVYAITGVVGAYGGSNAMAKHRTAPQGRPEERLAG